MNEKKEIITRYEILRIKSVPEALSALLSSYGMSGWEIMTVEDLTKPEHEYSIKLRKEVEEKK